MQVHIERLEALQDAVADAAGRDRAHVLALQVPTV
jgi:hypothetical protein